MMMRLFQTLTACLRPCSGAVCLLLWSILALVPAAVAEQGATGSARGQATPTQAATESSNASPGADKVSAGPTAIAVADIATRSAEVSDLLHNLANKLTRSEEIDEMIQSFPSAVVQSDRAAKTTKELLQRRPALPTLQAEQQKWQQVQLKFTNVLSTLTNRSNALQEALTQIAELQTTWSLTLDTGKSNNIPEAILQQIQATLTAIEQTRTFLEKELSKVLNFQSPVGDAVAKSGVILAEVTQLQETSMSGTLVQDSLPIWAPALWKSETSTFSVNFSTAFEAYSASLTHFFQIPLKRFASYGGFFILLLALFLAARFKARELSKAGLVFSPEVKVFDHPLAAALTIVLMLATSPYWSQMPSTIRDTFQLVALVPMIILIRPLVSAFLLPCVFALGILFAADMLREILSDQILPVQTLLILEAFIGGLVLIWFLRKIPSALSSLTNASRPRFLQIGTGFVLLILLGGFLSAAMGYVRLALLITPGIIAAGILAVTVYTTLLIALGIINIALKVWPIRTLGMVQHHRPLLERRIYRILVLAAIGGLIIRCLSYLGLLTPTLDFGKAILEVRIKLGVLDVSIEGILEFILTVCAAYLLSAFLRFVLREDIYPRVKLPQGNSYAVSSLLHYFIIAIGFLAAVSVIGIDLTKLTVLTGAFGIGLGFGLQGVVNNFVSGLILLFERPIHVGDTVEVGNLLGNVQRIGIRASTVHTVQGADIIVPNSQMIAEKVTNWTLSNRLRRVELPVGVSYGTNPELVIKVLEDVALKNTDVARFPPPQGLMVGYGDSSLNFELRAWTDQFDNWVQIRSQLAVAVYHAVTAAGMTFPFPQREVRLLKNDLIKEDNV